MGLSADALSAIAAHGETTWPRECCGLIVEDRDGRRWSRPGRNLSSRDDAFELDPATIVATRSHGEVIKGLYHSHCDAPAELSHRDLETLVLDGGPAWPGVDVFIASIDQGHCVCVRRFVWSASTGTYEAEGQAPW